MYKVEKKPLAAIFRAIESGLFILLATSFLLSSCERKSAPSSSEALPESSSKDNISTEPKFDPSLPKSVATTDEPIVIDAPVTGLTFWNHPNVTFNGLIIAATSNGIYTQTPEGKTALPELTADLGSINARGISLAYMPAKSAKTSPSSVREESFADGIFTIFDEDNKAFRFFSISNTSRKFNENILSIPYTDSFNDFCLTTDINNEGLKLFIVSNTAITEFLIASTQSNGYSLDLETKKQSKKIISCAVDPVTNELLALSSTGKIFNPIASSEGIQIPVSNPVDFQIAYEAPVSSDNKSQPQRRFVILDRDNALVHLFKGESNTDNLLGILKLTDFDDIKGVKMAETMAFGSGNFGGLYRFGAIALVTVAQENGEPKSAVRLTPYIAAARALEFTTTGTINPRNRTQHGQQKDDQGPEFEFDLNKFQPVKPE